MGSEPDRNNLATSDLKAPAHWPDGVLPISLEGLSLLGIDQKANSLYWDGQALVTKRRLDWPERGAALVGAGAAAILAIIELVRFFSGA